MHTTEEERQEDLPPERWQNRRKSDFQPKTGAFHPMGTFRPESYFRRANHL